MRRHRTSICARVAGGVLLLVTRLWAAETVEQPAERVFRNIQALKGLPQSQLINTMFFIRASLNASCSHCHVERFEKDDKPAKRTARKMMLMVQQLNASQFEGRPVISCNTCHRGQTTPEAPLPFAGIQDDQSEKRGAQTATELPTAAELFERDVQAAGGEAVLKSMTSRVMTGIRFSSEGWKAQVEIIQQAPDRLMAPLPGAITITVSMTSGRTNWRN